MLTIDSISYKDGKFYLSASYNENIDGEEAVLKVKDDEAFERGDPLDPNA